MKKKFNSEYPPLALLKKVSAERPEAWEQMKDFHDHNGKEGLPPWPDWCYAPMAASFAVASKGKADTFYEKWSFVSLSAEIAALAPWRISKEVFVIDEELKKLLSEQGGETDIPTEILLSLPYQCFYIELDNFLISGVHCCGVFVHLEYDVNNGDRELRLLYLADDGRTLGMPIHIDEKNLMENLKHTAREAWRNARVGVSEDTLEELEYDLGQTLQLILYILANNADIEPNSEQALITKRSATIKDKYSEIRKWNVGERIGNAIRKSRLVPKDEAKDISEPTTHASPRAHMRRGHWHHFWTGPRSAPEERKLILRWVAPTAIGVSDEEMPMVIHFVKE